MKAICKYIIIWLYSQLIDPNNKSCIFNWLALIFILFVGIGMCTPTLLDLHTMWERDHFGFYKLIPNDEETMPSKYTVIQDIVITNSIGMRLKLIPSGTFFMGSVERSKEYPVRKIILSKPFFISMYETTQQEWDAIIKTHPLESDGSNLPVVNVSVSEIQDFIKILSIKENKKYRLPTEAEWEYVCRAGTISKYYFGTNNTILNEYAWYYENSDNTPHSVGTKKPNAWGIYDMYGNVNELCLDNWGNYTIDNLIDPIGKGVKIRHVVYHVYRGGDCNSDDDEISSSNRWPMRTEKDNALGFRIIMVPDITYNN